MSKIAILTNFMEFNPGYSLTGIVIDQCKMLQSKGHEILLFVNSRYNLKENDASQFAHNIPTPLLPVKICRNIPFSHLVDYQSEKDLSKHHKEIAQTTKDMLLKQLSDVEYVFTHDLVFQGWFLPYGLGVIEAAKELPDTKFLHWLHSTPTSGRDWWNFNSWGGSHKIIFPNKTERVRVAEQYKTLPNNVACIPHIKDLRTWNDFCPDSNYFLEEHPELLDADIVQIYPASSDRFQAKRLHVVMEIFSNFKKRFGYKICLVCANQWATGRQRKEDVNTYIDLAKNLGLIPDKEFIFTSEWNGGKYDTGIPKRMLRDLASLSNMFIFPTREESFGLVGVEIPLSTACITVTNRSLKMMAEIHQGAGMDFNFGSFHENFSVPDEHQYHADIALLIHNELKLNEVVLHRTFLKQTYNWNYLYRNYYMPVMGTKKV